MLLETDDELPVNVSNEFDIDKMQSNSQCRCFDFQNIRYLTKALFFAAILFVPSGFFIIFIVKGSMPMNDSYSKESRQSNKFCFIIITSDNEVSRQRQKDQSNSWTNEIAKRGHTVKYIAEIAKENRVLPSECYISPDKNLYQYGKNNTSKHSKTLLKGNIDRAIKRITACQYFLRETNDAFLWIMTDDVYVDVNKLDKVTRSYAKKYNTKKEIKVFGNCVYIKKSKKSYSFAYLQGGVGYIFSRAAAKLAVENGPKWIESIKREDDFDFNVLLDMMNISIRETAFSIGTGNIFTHDIYPGFENNISKCAGNEYLEQCNSGLNPLADIVAVHSDNTEKTKAWIKIISELSSKSDRYYWWQNGTFPTICKK